MSGSIPGQRGTSIDRIRGHVRTEGGRNSHVRRQTISNRVASADCLLLLLSLLLRSHVQTTALEDVAIL